MCKFISHNVAGRSVQRKVFSQEGYESPRLRLATDISCVPYMKENSMMYHQGLPWGYKHII